MTARFPLHPPPLRSAATDTLPVSVQDTPLSLPVHFSPVSSHSSQLPEASLAAPLASDADTDLTYLVPTKNITGTAHGVYAWKNGEWSGPLNTGLPTHLKLQYAGIAVNDTDPDM